MWHHFNNISACSLGKITHKSPTLLKIKRCENKQRSDMQNDKQFQLQKNMSLKILQGMQKLPFPQPETDQINFILKAKSNQSAKHNKEKNQQNFCPQAISQKIGLEKNTTLLQTTQIPIAAIKELIEKVLKCCENFINCRTQMHLKALSRLEKKFIKLQKKIKNFHLTQIQSKKVFTNSRLIHCKQSQQQNYLDHDNEKQFSKKENQTNQKQYQKNENGLPFDTHSDLTSKNNCERSEKGLDFLNSKIQNSQEQPSLLDGIQENFLNQKESINFYQNLNVISATFDKDEFVNQRKYPFEPETKKKLFEPLNAQIYSDQLLQSTKKKKINEEIYGMQNQRHFISQKRLFLIDQAQKLALRGQYFFENEIYEVSNTKKAQKIVIQESQKINQQILVKPFTCEDKNLTQKYLLKLQKNVPSIIDQEELNEKYTLSKEERLLLNEIKELKGIMKADGQIEQKQKFNLIQTCQLDCQMNLKGLQSQLDFAWRKLALHKQKQKYLINALIKIKMEIKIIKDSVKELIPCHYCQFKEHIQNFF